MPPIKQLIAAAMWRLGYTVIPNWRVKTYAQEAFLRRLFNALGIDCVFDVGANVGQYHDFLRQEVGYEGVIVSFEPVPANVNVLMQKASNDAKWIVEGYALGRSPGEATLNVMASTEFSSFLEPDNSVVGRFSESNVVQQQILVPVRTLDEVMDALRSRIGFTTPYLKLDTQGFDLEVVAGATQTITQFKALQTEASIKPIYAGMPDYVVSIERLRSLGFEVSGLFPVNDAAFPLLVEIDCHMILKESASTAALSR